MPHIHDIQCDYDNCTQMFKREPNNWWEVIVYTTQVVINSFTKYTTEERQGFMHACCVDHALKLVAREMEKLAPTLSEPHAYDSAMPVPYEPFVEVSDCNIDEDDIPF